MASERPARNADRGLVRRIAIVRPSALGDVCRTVPVLVSLRRAFPDAAIDWVVQDTFIDAVQAHPDLTEAVPFHRDRYAAFGRRAAATQAGWAWAKALRHRRYDLVYDCQGLARSGLISWLTRAPRRVGLADAREGGHLGYTHKHDVSAGWHTVDRMLGLIEADGVPAVRDLRLYVPPEASLEWRQRQAALGIEGMTRYALLAPTSRWESKRWPAARFAALIDPLLERGFERVLLVGAGSEHSQCAPLLARASHDARVVDLLGQTTVGGLMATIADAALVVANDSAALHMAVGFDRPYVALFGPTDVSRVGPYRGERWVVQASVEGVERLNHKDTALGASIMERIGVGEVLARIDERLAC